MEDVVSDLLPGAAEVAFVDLPATVEAAIASVVIVAPRERMREAAEALKASTEAGGIRPILIVSDAESTPAVRSSPDGVVLEGLKPEHLDNAVAALRLSSLPTLVWWRGGSPGVTERFSAGTSLKAMASTRLPLCPSPAAHASAAVSSGAPAYRRSGAPREPARRRSPGSPRRTPGPARSRQCEQAAP